MARRHSDSSSPGAPSPAASRRFGRSTLYLLFGPIVWSLHFFVLYGPQSLLCARGEIEVVGPVLTLATVVCALALLGAVVAPARLARLLRLAPRPAARQAFLDAVMRVLAALSLFAVLAAGAAIWILPSCPSLR